MEPWLIPLLSLLTGVIGGVIGAYVGARVLLAEVITDMRWVKDEVVKLREAKHEHAQRITEHEMDLVVVKRRVGL